MICLTPTFEILAFQLSGKTVQIIPGSAKLRALSFPLLYDPSVPVRENQCVLINAKDMAAPENLSIPACFICCQGIPSFRCSSICSLIILDPSISVAAAFNQIQAVYEMFVAWNNQLNNLLRNNVTPQQVLDLSSPVLGNLLKLTDDNQIPAAVSYQGHYADISDFPQPSVLEKEKTTGLDRMTVNFGDHSYDLDVQGIQGSGGTLKTLFVQFNLTNNNIAALEMLPVDHPLGVHDQQLLLILAPYILVQLLRPFELESKHNQELLLALIKGQNVPENDISRLETLLRYSPSDEFRCIVLRLPSGSLSKSGMYLRRRIQLVCGASLSGVLEDHMISIINVSKQGWNEEIFFKSIQDCLGDAHFIAAASDSFHTLAVLKDYYHEAGDIACLPGKPVSHVLHMSDCWESFVMTCCCGRLPREMLYPSGLKDLIDYNSQSGVDYLKTLRIYIEEGRNDSRTAAKLYISRNSFLYRLEKIRSVLNNPLEDPEYLFRLELSLRLYDFPVSAHTVTDIPNPRHTV